MLEASEIVGEEGEENPQANAVLGSEPGFLKAKVMLDALEEGFNEPPFALAPSEPLS